MSINISSTRQPGGDSQEPVKEQKETNPLDKTLEQIATDLLGYREPQFQQGLQTLVLRGFTSSSEEAEALKAQFTLSKTFQELPQYIQDQVVSHCLQDYQKAAVFYEISAAALFLNDPEAKSFAAEMCKRMGALVEAHRRLTKEGEQESGSAASASEKAARVLAKPNLPPQVMSELKDNLIFGKLFGNSAIGAGSVGFNPIAIQHAIAEGSLREQMTLTYCVVFSFVLNDILKDKESVLKINAQLNEMKAGFQLDLNLIESERAVSGSLLKPTDRILHFRNVEKARLEREKQVAQPSSDAKGMKLSEIPNLTLREARAALEDPGITEKEFEEMRKGSEEGKKLGERRVKWLSGQDYWLVHPESSLAKEIQHLGLPPTSAIAGPSGTIDGFLHAAKYIGMGDKMREGTKAAIAWMVPTRDHALHEILMAASDHGIPYGGLPQDFEHCFDPKTTKALSDMLDEQNVKMPAYYLSEAHQKIVAATIVAEAASEELDRVEAEVPMPPSLRGISATPQLLDFNHRLRQLEARSLALEPLIVQAIKEKSPFLADLRKEKVRILEKFTKLQVQKADYVKQHYPDNPVYAMAVPRLLPGGTSFYCAGSEKKMERLLVKEGFTWPEDAPATGYAKNFKADGIFGVNEMGEKGRYFSKDTPAYLGGSGKNEAGAEITLDLCLRCDLTDEVEGVSILPVSELHTKAFGFSGDQIEAGYRALQKAYPFLQNDGLSPKDTEVVYLRTANKLQPTQVLFSSQPWSPASRDVYSYSIAEFLEMSGIETPVHPSWTQTEELAPMRTGTEIKEIAPPPVPPSEPIAT